MSNHEAIQRAYEEAELEGKLEDLALRVPGENELAVVPAWLLDSLREDNERLERQLDDIKTEKSMNWFSAQGFDDRLIGPEAVVSPGVFVAKPSAFAGGGSEFPLTLHDTMREAVASALGQASTTYEVVHRSYRHASDDLPHPLLRSPSAKARSTSSRSTTQAGALRTHKRKTESGS